MHTALSSYALVGIEAVPVSAVADGDRASARLNCMPVNASVDPTEARNKFIGTAARVAIGERTG
jgi:hypothetical protein